MTDAFASIPRARLGRGLWLLLGVALAWPVGLWVGWSFCSHVAQRALDTNRAAVIAAMGDDPRKHLEARRRLIPPALTTRSADLDNRLLKEMGPPGAQYSLYDSDPVAAQFAARCVGAHLEEIDALVDALPKSVLRATESTDTRNLAVNLGEFARFLTRSIRANFTQGDISAAVRQLHSSARLFSRAAALFPQDYLSDERIELLMDLGACGPIAARRVRNMQMELNEGCLEALSVEKPPASSPGDTFGEYLDPTPENDVLLAPADTMAQAQLMGSILDLILKRPRTRASAPTSGEVEYRFFARVRFPSPFPSQEFEGCRSLAAGLIAIALFDRNYGGLPRDLTDPRLDPQLMRLAGPGMAFLHTPDGRLLLFKPFGRTTQPLPGYIPTTQSTRDPRSMYREVNPLPG